MKPQMGWKTWKEPNLKENAAELKTREEERIYLRCPIQMINKAGNG